MGMELSASHVQASALTSTPKMHSFIKIDSLVIDVSLKNSELKAAAETVEGREERREAFCRNNSILA